MKGLPVVEPEKLLASQAEILAQYKRSVIVDAEQYEKHYMGALRRFASYAHLVPASQAHHHRGAGGLLRHSMEVALGALQGADKMLLNVGKTPAQRRAIEPRWQLTAFLAGLCHDVGKPATDITIINSDRNRTWKPLTEDLYVWAKQAKINSYFIDWKAGRGKQHIALSNLIAERIIGPESLQWIEEGGTDLVVWLMEALNGSPGAANPLYDLVIRADQSSVERDLKSMGVAMAGYEVGVPVERHLTDIMRRLIKEGVWQINEPSARVWNIEGGIYLVRPAAGEEIARKVREDGVPGFPRTHDGILDMLRERGLAFIREGEGDRFWKIAPAVLEAKIPNIALHCIRLRDDTLISSVPIPVVAGKLRNGEDEAPVEEDASTGRGALNLLAPVQVQVAAETAVGAPQIQASPDAEALAQHTSGSAEAIISAHQSQGALESEAARIVKPALAEFIVDQATGEILGIKPGDPTAKKQPSLRELPAGEVSEAKLAISKPSGLKIKLTAGTAADEGAGPAPKLETPALPIEDAGPVGAPRPKKARKKKDYSKEPELKFTGSVGELFLALADDLKTGVKKWGLDVRVDDEEMVLLRWPASFANYGLSGKNILDECTKNEWIWVDRDTPAVRLVDSTFGGEDCKALRLMPEPGDALLFHARYKPDVHGGPAVKMVAPPSKEAEYADPEPVLKPHSEAAEQEKASIRSKEKAPQEGHAKRADLGSQSKVAKPQGAELDTSSKHAKERTGRARQDSAAETRVKAKGDVAVEVEKTAAASPQPTTTVDAGTDGRVAALLSALASCPQIKMEEGWRYVDRGDLKRIALETGAAKDRKDLNLLIEENAKTLQVKGSTLRYQIAT